MKDLTLIVYLGQLGLSVALPMAGFVLLAVWLRNTFQWGQWVIFVGIGLGLICAIESLLTTLKALSRISRKNKGKDDAPPPVSFNDHQ
jgi:hypothetical protein